MRTLVCHCPCGSTRFNITAGPLFRFNCHCTICQRFNRAAFGDVLVYRSASVSAPPEGAVSFQSYKQLPPKVQRGKCSECGEPAIELLHLPLMPHLTIIPRNMLPDDASLPSVSFHGFYDKHVIEPADQAPRCTGFLRSQLAFMSHLIRSLWRGSRA